MRYRLVDVRIWGDEKFRALSPLPPSGQSLFIYLLTNPNTNVIPGLYRAGEMALAEELNWSLDAFRHAYQEVFAQGIAQADFCARVLYVPNAIKYNKPQSINVIKSWATHWDEIPECALKHIAYQGLKAFIDGMGEGFRLAFSKAIVKPKGMTRAIQEQEQEQEQEHKSICAKEKTAQIRKVKNSQVRFEEFWKVYPKKKDKVRASALWQRKKLDEKAELIIASVLNHIANEPQWQNQQFIPHPSTFLNGEEWNNEIITSKQGNSNESASGYVEKLKRAGEIALAARNVSSIQGNLGEEVD